MVMALHPAPLAPALQPVPGGGGGEALYACAPRRKRQRYPLS